MASATLKADLQKEEQKFLLDNPDKAAERLTKALENNDKATLMKLISQIKVKVPPVLYAQLDKVLGRKDFLEVAIERKFDERTLATILTKTDAPAARPPMQPALPPCIAYTIALTSILIGLGSCIYVSLLK